MSGKLIWVAAVVVLGALSPSACRKNDKVATSAGDDQVFVSSKKFVIGRARHGRAENPPCIRRGMEDVLEAAKGFATQQKSASFGFIGKELPVTPIVLEDPRTSGGVSVVTRSVEEELRGVKAETARALAAEDYASCGTVAFLLPPNTTQIRVVMSAANEDDNLQPCDVVQGDYTKCEIGNAAWTLFHEDRYFIATFKNWSETLGRTAQIELVPSLAR